ncbi:unnamed protein product [Ambrosiozyma monospora]|uniref:Unnamed protein product n=1 Tax=Ambrosiozyma monospora TaxID=43982 RepID=A0A9W7DEZ9_AMBMO|nr:unnamed protein product [Ambrosiozyma monospora]
MDKKAEDTILNSRPLDTTTSTTTANRSNSPQKSQSLYSLWEDDDNKPTTDAPKRNSTVSHGRRRSSWAFWSASSEKAQPSKSNTETLQPSEQSVVEQQASIATLKNKKTSAFDLETQSISTAKTAKTVRTTQTNITTKSVKSSKTVRIETPTQPDHTDETVQAKLPKERASSWTSWPTFQLGNSSSCQPKYTNIILTDASDVSNVSDQPPPLPPKNSPTTEDHSSKTSIKSTRPNLVVPSLESTLPHASYQARLSRGYDKFRYYFGLDQSVQSRSLLLRPTSAQIKNVLIIGVHGFFPTKVLRPILGEPTGTSLRFAQSAEQAINSWSKENGLNVNIQKIALEREGKVFDRVDFFFDIMKSYEEDVKKADFIFVCAHSQGCPVSIMLMSKLIEHGVIATHTKIGVLCMAGINNGPYNVYKVGNI